MAPPGARRFSKVHGPRLIAPHCTEGRLCPAVFNTLGPSIPLAVWPSSALALASHHARTAILKTPSRASGATIPQPPLLRMSIRRCLHLW